MPGQTGGLRSIACAALACGALLGCSHKSEPASATTTGATPPPPFAKSPPEESYEKEDPLGLQIANFCGVIRGTAEPVVSGREGLKTLRVIDAVKRAAETGDLVSV